MGKKTVLLLVTVCVLTFGVTTAVLLLSRRGAAGGTGAAASPGSTFSVQDPAYAYITDQELVVMRGDRTVARVPRFFDEADAEENQVSWTPDGTYAVFLSTLVIGKDLGAQKIVFVNARTGAIGKVRCPGCVSFAATGGSRVLALTYQGQHPEVLRFDLDSPGRPTALSSRALVTAQYLRFLTGLDGHVIVGALRAAQARGPEQNEDFYGITADGSRGSDYGYSYDIQPIVASAEQTTYGHPTAAIAVDSDPGTCGNQAAVFLVGTASAERTETDMSAALPPARASSSGGGNEVDDLWWGQDGHLHATIGTWTCDGDRKVSSRPSSLWRLDGTWWVPEDPEPAAMVRRLDRSRTVSLVIPSCTGHPGPVTCDSGRLYRDNAGRRKLVAEHVISISAPPWSRIGTGDGSPSPPSASPSIGSSGPPVSATALKSFTGVWSQFGSSVEIHADGRFTLQYKTFRTCATAPAPCDPKEADNSWGGLASGRITAVDGTHATGVIAGTNGPAWAAHGAHADFELLPNRTLDVVNPPRLRGRYCGPESPPGYCGGM